VPQRGLNANDAAGLVVKTYLVFGGYVESSLVCYFVLQKRAGRAFTGTYELYVLKVPARQWKGYQAPALARQAVFVAYAMSEHV